MGVAVAIGSVLPDAVFYLKYNSVTDFSIYFWDDPLGTVASDLTAATATVEVDSPSAGTVLATGTRVGTTNQMQFVVSTASSITVPDGTPFRVVLTKSSNRFIFASGKVRVQK